MRGTGRAAAHSRRGRLFDVSSIRTPSTRKATVVGWALALGVAGALALAPACAKTPGEVDIGEPLPAATMQGLNGPSRNLSDFRGRPLVINVWASWCGPCREEMASLERLAWRDEAASFTVIGISTDDHVDAARALLKRTNATISHFIDRRLLLENMLGASRIPLTVLVDADGRVIDKVYGAREWDGPEALQLIDRAFRRKAVAPTR